MWCSYSLENENLIFTMDFFLNSNNKHFKRKVYFTMRENCETLWGSYYHHIPPFATLLFMTSLVHNIENYLVE